MKNFLAVISLFFYCLTVHSTEVEVSYRCKFSDGQSTTFDNSNPVSKKSEFPELIFDKVNSSKGTARLIGNNGIVEIYSLPGSDSVHLIEQTPTGNLSIVTIFTNEKYAKMNSYPVVLSRHMGIASTPLTSQYRGSCRILK
jgi:hypothetical protein